MFARSLITLFAVASLGLAVAAAQAADKTHSGKVVSASEGKLVMTDNEGKNEHTHMIAASVTVTLNGKSAKLSELAKGDTVVVTTNDEKKVTAIAATRAKS
jgi:Ni/Co efflux regulator RcnB